MSELIFRILGSGYQILMPARDLPAPFKAVQLGMIDRCVDGFYYWYPDKQDVARGSIFPAWVLREIADKIDRLNESEKEEPSQEELLKEHYDNKRLAHLIELDRTNKN